MGREVVVTFSDWSGGEYGARGPWRAKDGQWTGKNVRFLKNGSICPRPGLKKGSYTGDQNGACWGVYFTSILNRELVTIVDNDVFRGDFDPTNGDITFTSIGAVSGGAPTEHCYFQAANQNSELFFISPEDQVYRIADLSTSPSIGAVTSSPGGRTLRIWQDRMYGSDDATSGTAHRLYYSTAADFDAGWGSNYVDVGYLWILQTAVPLRGRLLIGTQGDGWYALSGAPDGGAELRKITGLSPDEARAVVHDTSADHLWFFQTRSDAETDETKRGLCWSNGVVWDADRFDHLELTGGAVHGAFSHRNRDIVFVAADATAPTGLLRTDGTWTYHEYGVDLDGPITPWSQEQFMLVGGSGAAAKANYWMLDTSIQRPAFTSDYLARPGDNTDTPLDAEVTTRILQAGKGAELRPKHAYVHFTSYDWDGSSGGSNQIDLQARATSRWDNDPKWSTAHSWTEDTSAASTAGTDRRAYFSLGDQGYGAGVQVKLSNLQGVVVHQVDIVCDRIEPRGGV